MLKIKMVVYFRNNDKDDDDDDKDGNSNNNINEIGTINLPPSLPASRSPSARSYRAASSKLTR